MKRRTRESIVRNTTRLMTATASDIAGPSEEVVLEGDESEGDESKGYESEGDESEGNESEGNETEGNESHSVKLDDTFNICKKAGLGYVLILLNLRDFN